MIQRESDPSTERHDMGWFGCFCIKKQKKQKKQNIALVESRTQDLPLTKRVL